MSEWQPIETAPKGGTIILLYHLQRGQNSELPVVGSGCWGIEGWAHIFNDGSWRNVRATHWMPLPEPPK